MDIHCTMCNAALKGRLRCEQCGAEHVWDEGFILSDKWAKVEVKEQLGDLVVLNCAVRCRVCDTSKCGTMYCKKCWDSLMSARDSLDIETE